MEHLTSIVPGIYHVERVYPEYTHTFVALKVTDDQLGELLAMDVDVAYLEGGIPAVIVKRDEGN